MTLATADNDVLPWVSPVEFVCDENLAFYWVSMTSARHSQNLRANPRAAFSIYDNTQTPGVNMVQGLYGENRLRRLLPRRSNQSDQLWSDGFRGGMQTVRRPGPLSEVVSMTPTRHGVTTGSFPLPFMSLNTWWSASAVSVLIAFRASGRENESPTGPV